MDGGTRRLRARRTLDNDEDGEDTVTQERINSMERDQVEIIFNLIFVSPQQETSRKAMLCSLHRLAGRRSSVIHFPSPLPTFCCSSSSSIVRFACWYRRDIS
jgi:hypothetical protein